MGFFKNLFKGDFKKIGKNFVNNLSEGRLVKGTGIDGIINGAANAASGGALLTVGAVLPDRIGDGIFKEDPQTGKVVKWTVPDSMNNPNVLNIGNKMGWVDKPSEPISSSNPVILDPVLITAKKEAKEQGKSFIDVNNDGKDDTTTILVVVGIAVAGWLFIKKRK